MFSKERTMEAWVTSFPTNLKIGSVFSTQQVFSSHWRQQDTCNHEKELHQVGHYWLDSEETGAETCISCWNQVTIECSTINRTTLSPLPRLRACCGERVDRCSELEDGKACYASLLSGSVHCSCEGTIAPPPQKKTNKNKQTDDTKVGRKLTGKKKGSARGDEKE